MIKNEENSSKKQQDILKAATRIFAQRDYHKVTMEEIADAAKVGKGTLYRYYKNKEDLYFSIIKKGLETLYEYITREAEKEEDLLSRIKKVISCALIFFEKNKPFVKVFLQEEVKFQTKGFIHCKESLDKSIRLIENLIAQGQKEGVFKTVDVSVAASLLIGMSKAIFLKSLEMTSRLNVQENTELIAQVFLYGLINEKKEVRK